ncbi:MAG: NAD(P)/FAD-dependent oxidoreductase [Chloroflexota bacterium]|nr:NAD(P)/FAD-dependent oxidoreductase [Chloroflexota bacterium]
MTEKSLIIIGAGLAGLSTGCYAQMNGYQSHIFEHHAVPGGVAATWKRKGYLIDGGIHFVTGHKPGTALHELYRELGIVPATRFVDMTTYGRFTDEVSGRSVEVTHDLNRLADDLKALAPGDARVIGELIACACAMRGLDMSEMGMSKPPGLAGPLDQLKEIWNVRHLFRYFTGKYARPVADYVQAVHDPWLRECIKNLFLPESPVWFVCMVLGLLADGQMGLLAGGSLDFVRPIEKRYKTLGGRVTYKATVEEILVETCLDRSQRDDRAVGVRLADGSEHRADIVVSAADGYNTIFKMLGGRYVNEEIRNRYASWKLCRPLVMVSYGVAREFPHEPVLTTIMLEHPFTVGNQAVDGIFVRIFNYSPRFAPSGKTVVQVEFETEWDYWNDLQREDRARYNSEKERVAAEILKRLEAHYPGVSSQVEVTDVATPYTTWRYTLNRKGAWGGWLLAAEMINTQMKRTLPGLANFYMAGQWVMPGGGVPPCLYSGRHVVQLLCHRDRKLFSSGDQSSRARIFD